MKGGAGPAAGPGLSAEPLLRLDALRLLRALLFVGALLLAWVSLKPFPDLRGLDLLELQSGNDQLTYLAFGGLAVAALFLVLRDHGKALGALASPALLALGAWASVGVALSQDPGTSLRRFALTGAVAGVAAALPLLPQGRAELTRLLQVAAWALLVLCFLGVLLAPDLSIHQRTDAQEPLLAGLWRGVFGHKNVAAAMMAMLVFVGLYAARAGFPLSGLALAVLSALFLAGTGGKSAMALCVLVLVLTALAAPVRSFAVRALLCLLPVVVLNLLSVGAVLSETLAAAAKVLPVDATFTGRTDIWRFALDSIAQRPWTGHGFAAFWGTETVRASSEQGADWAGYAAHSHNGYLDTALTLGIPGLVLLVLAFVLAPLRDYGRVDPRSGEGPLALLFLRIWLFGVSLSAMESIFFERADPIWFTFLAAVFGLRYLGRFRTAG